MEQWLKDRAFHSWVDPRTLESREEWVWAEMNAFHSADVSKQLLTDIDNLIMNAEYLRKKERGEAEVNLFKDIWTRISQDKDK